ncbi:MAG: hypothetical protein C4297_05695 [Gemmataceae bacterium]
MHRHMIFWGMVGALSLMPALGHEPCRSGLQVGQRPGPYSFLVSTGPKRGQQHCFICETGDRPAVIVFARTPDEELAVLARHVDGLLEKYRDSGLTAWVTFLSDQQPALDETLVAWSKSLRLRHLPLGVYEDAQGPPAYRLDPEAEVTVMIAVKQKVTANFAFRRGELARSSLEAFTEAVTKTLPK